LASRMLLPLRLFLLLLLLLTAQCLDQGQQAVRGKCLAVEAVLIPQRCE